LLQDVRGGQFGVDHLDLAAVEHDLLDRPLAEVERAENPVAVLLLDDALGMAELQRTLDLLAHREDVAVGVDAHAEDGQHSAHQPAHEGHHRREDPHHDPDRPGHEARRRLGIRDRVGLRKHLCKDQHQCGHHQRRQRHAGLPERACEQRRGQRGRENIDEVVAEKNRADQPLAVLGDPERPRRPLVPAVGLRAQLPARRRRQCRFGAREKGRQDEKSQDRARGEPEGAV